MTGRERVEALLAGRRADRPPFCPAVYEHKAALIGETPSNVARDAGLLERAVAREIDLYAADLVVVGCDVYNVEAEALGGKVRFPDTNDVPAVESRTLRPGGDIGRLGLPDPRRDGRMPLFIEAGRRLVGRFGRERMIRGAASAPFSLAAEMVGLEDLLLAMIDDPAWVRTLLGFTAEVVRLYGRAWVENGLGVILFDSHAAPPLVSPKLYRDLILPATRDAVSYLRDILGLPLVPYIIGGDTAPILGDILSTGTNNILCDFKADLAAFVDRTRNLPVLLRANLDPRFLAAASPRDIEARARKTVVAGRLHPRFMLGTGILAYDLPPEKVLAVRAALESEKTPGV